MLSSPPPLSLHLPESILHCSNDHGSDIVIVDLGMQNSSISTLDSPLLMFSLSQLIHSSDKQVPCAYINETPAHCTAIVMHVFLCGHRPFRADNTITFAQQNADSVPDHDQAKSFVRHLVALDPLHRPSALADAVRYPWLATTTTTDAPFHVDLPTLTQNWNPKTK